MRGRGRTVALLVAAGAWLAAAGGPSAAQERSLPVDCFPDGVPVWDAAEPNPQARFGAQYVPGVLIGPPGPSGATTGSTTVASLGFGGRMVYRLEDVVIEDGPGPDFIVFENAFFRGSAPTSEEDDYELFAEPGWVDVSADGETWERFPYDEEALAAASNDGEVDKALHRRLTGLAGVTPTVTGNWTVPDDREVWDPEGVGGVSGAGGDAFDLADVGLESVRFVRVTDTDSRNGFTGSAEGFDQDALVVLHGRPRAPTAADADGDGLSDSEEQEIYGTLVDLADSDGDGTSDGREVARCRDPLTGGDTSPWWAEEPRVWLQGGECTEVRWSRIGEGTLYDVVRGELAQLQSLGGVVDLGALSCLAADTEVWRFSCDGEVPLPGEGRFYLVSIGDGSDFGRSSRLEPREGESGCE